MSQEKSLGLYTALTPCLDDLLSGYHRKRNLASHNGITAGIYCFFALEGDLEAVELIAEQKERVVSYICAMRDERVEETPYMSWHEATRELTDHLDDHGYTEKPSINLFADLVGLFDEWYQENGHPPLQVNKMLEFIQQDIAKRQR